MALAGKARVPANAAARVDALMALRKILRFPDPKLREKSRDVEVFDEELRTLVADMTETMFDANGAYKPNKDNTVKDALSLGLSFTAVQASY
jgi:peptide deformylase